MTLATDQGLGGEFSPKAFHFKSLRDAVMKCWEAEVRLHIQGADNLLSPILTNTLPAFFDNIAEALSTTHPRKDATSNTNAAAVHGDERARMTSFRPDQVIHEYQIFRESIAQVTVGKIVLSDNDWLTIDQSINLATREAIKAYTFKHEELRHKLAAALSHDMRTPLTVIGTAAHLLTKNEDRNQVKRIASKIQASTLRLASMMSELVDTFTLSSVAQIPLKISRCDMRQMIDDLRKQYCEDIECHIKFDLMTAEVIGYWCENSIRRALENLINNAIKYGDGKIVRTSVRQSFGRLMLSVHNDGNVISKDTQTKIFDYLSRADKSTTPGWGIGLEYVKNIAESHGGSVSVDSSEEAGTTFLIDIPIDCRPYT